MTRPVAVAHVTPNHPEKHGSALVIQPVLLNQPLPAVAVYNNRSAAACSTLICGVGDGEGVADGIGVGDDEYE